MNKKLLSSSQRSHCWSRNWYCSAVPSQGGKISGSPPQKGQRPPNNGHIALSTLPLYRGQETGQNGFPKCSTEIIVSKVSVVPTFSVPQGIFYIQIKVQ